MDENKLNKVSDEERYEKGIKLGIFNSSNELIECDLTEDEVYILQHHLYDGYHYRCPICNLNTVNHIKIAGEKFADVPAYHSGVKKLSRKYHCFNCKNNFDDLKKLALIDGIFLNENKNLKERTYRYVEELCKELKLSDDVKSKVIEIVEDYDENWGFRGIVCASIYLASIMCGERRTQFKISDAAKLRDTTWRKYYKKISKKLGY